MITAFRQSREYSSVPSCLIVGGTQKQKITAEQKTNFRLEKEKPMLEAFWSALDQQRLNKGNRWQAVNYAKIGKTPDDLSWKTVIAVYPTILARMQSDHSLLVGRTGCSAPVLKEHR